MKVFLIILNLTFISCSSFCDMFFNANKLIEIYQIDSYLLNDYYIIKFKQNNKKGIIISKVENKDCLNNIKVKGKYNFTITKIKTTESFTKGSISLTV